MKSRASKPSNILDRRRLVLSACVIVCLYVLSINKEITKRSFETNLNLSEGTQTNKWMDTSGVSLFSVQGDPTKCKDVIYSADTRDPYSDVEWLSKGIESMEYITHASSVLRESTCYAFVKISSPFLDSSGRKLHPVWGRIPATALVMNVFPNAEIFLYMDSDALLPFSSNTPTMMYDELAFDGYGDNPSMTHLKPGLIVNKVKTGWMCSQCENYELEHGCFNSGTLLWNRTKAEPILREWWESRNTKDNFVHPETGEGFHGWNGDEEFRLSDKMGEQNRLMYVYGSNPLMQELIWPVPRQRSEGFNSLSCPNAVDKGHKPCLQNDASNQAEFDPSNSDKFCFVSHFCNHKDMVVEVADKIMTYKESPNSTEPL